MLLLHELEICEFTEKLLKKVDIIDDTVTISMVNRQIQVKNQRGELIVMDSTQRVPPERVNMKRTRSELKNLEPSHGTTEKTCSNFINHTVDPISSLDLTSVSPIRKMVRTNNDDVILIE
jgi:NADPH:quinone reductase-like Zn-dependent oxidoreductase